MIEAQTIGRFQIVLGALLFLVMLTDGYDALVMGYAAPLLVKAWGIPRSALGPIFGAGLFGLMLGAAVFGPLGDRFGRKRMLILCALLLGLFSLATMWARSLDQMLALRFLAGLGIGGVLPNAIALGSEYSPRRVQATAVWIIMAGYSAGAALGAVVANQLAAKFGWPVLFLVGGAAPLVCVLLLSLFLAESVRFLALDPTECDRVAAILNRMDRRLTIDDRTRFVISEEKRAAVPLRHLFAGGRATVTIFLWLAFIGNLMTLHFLVNWVPTVLESPAIPRDQAAIAGAMLPVGGIVGGLIVSLFLDRKGMASVAILFALGVPLIALIGYGGQSATLATVLTFGAGFCVIGGQTNLNAVAGRIYPTVARSNGVGWANSVGRLGSVAGPVIGGMLIALDLDGAQLFYCAAVPVAAAALACLVIGRASAGPIAGRGATETVGEAGGAGVPTSAR